MGLIKNEKSFWHTGGQAVMVSVETENHRQKTVAN